MRKSHCVSCGVIMGKSALDDPYVCRPCDNMEVPRFNWLDT